MLGGRWLSAWWLSVSHLYWRNLALHWCVVFSCTRRTCLQEATFIADKRIQLTVRGG